jgi:hypothetical protein
VRVARRRRKRYQRRLRLAVLSNSDFLLEPLLDKCGIGKFIEAAIPAVSQPSARGRWPIESGPSSSVAIRGIPEVRARDMSLHVSPLKRPSDVASATKDIRSVRSQG